MDTASDSGVYTASRSSRAEVVFETLKGQLLAGEHPLSARMAEERLAAEFAVSRTPVREALSRLHAEGLLERRPDGGFVPRVPDLDEIVELYEVRAALERAAIEKPHHDGYGLGLLRADWQAMADDLESLVADPAFVVVDEDFHLRLAASAGNRALVVNLIGVNERIRCVRMHDFVTVGRLEATIEQHLGIIDALTSGDATAASRLDAHLDESASVVHERAAHAIARMVGERRYGR